MLTDKDIAEIRDWIGDDTPPTDDDLFDIEDRMTNATPLAIAHLVLRKRLGTYLAEPASFTITGVYQESSGDNIRGLQTLLTALEAKDPGLTGDGSTDGLSLMRTSRLIRLGRSR